MSETPDARPSRDALTPLGVGALLLVVVAGVGLATQDAASTALQVITTQSRSAALIAIGAAAIGWGVTRGSRLAVAGGALLFADLVGRLVTLFVLLAQARGVLRPWFVFEAVSVVGIALVAWDVALARHAARRPRLGFAGATVAALGVV
ncbi:MAG: hypothetical protein EP329_03485, partial [Deltaproteobacteria bacterium]